MISTEVSKLYFQRFIYAEDFSFFAEYLFKERKSCKLSGNHLKEFHGN